MADDADDKAGHQKQEQGLFHRLTYSSKVNQSPSSTPRELRR